MTDRVDTSVRVFRVDGLVFMAIDQAAPASETGWDTVAVAYMTPEQADQLSEQLRAHARAARGVPDLVAYMPGEGADP